MRIGLDFDNTIVCYDGLFHRVAAEQGLIPADLPRNKVAVRDYLRRIGREPAWTELQGTVYGGRMAEAETYPGVRDFMVWAVAQGIELFIVSHKTRHPFLGAQYDLHQAARDWVDASLVHDGAPLIPAERVYFELTKEEKLARIGACGCGLFLDDLPEILAAPGFPPQTEPLLFDPEGHHPTVSDIVVLASWDMFRRHVAARCSATP